MSHPLSIKQRELNSHLMLWEALRNLDTDVAYFIINSEPDDEELEYTEEQKEEVLEQYLDELDELIKNKYKELYNVDLVR